MVRDVAAAVGAARARRRPTPGGTSTCVGSALEPERVDVRVLEQQQVVVGRRARAARAAAPRPRGTEPRPSHRARSGALTSSSASQSRVSSTVAHRVRGTTAAYAPSNARWSHASDEQPDVVDRDRVVAVGALDHDRLACGCRRSARIATCGWLMIGSVSVGAERAQVRDRERAADDLVGAELLALAPGSARSWISRAIRRSRLPSALRITGAIEPLKSRSTAIAEVDVAVHDERRRRRRSRSRAGSRRTTSQNARAMNGRYVSEKPSSAFHSRLVRAPDALDPLEVDLDRRVHVRARRLRPHHVLGGAAADVVERHDLVARAAHGGAGAARRRRGRRRRRRRRGRGRGAGAGAGGRRRGAARRAGAGAAPSAASSTSLRVMRPPSPVPRIVRGVEAAARRSAGARSAT